MNKHYLIYKITNTVNNKIYVGCHETDDVDDGYMGSGTLLKRAQKKYGSEHFKKEILFECSNRDEMYCMEADIVDDVFVSRLDTYNITVGGHGAFWFINKNGLNHKGGQHLICADRYSNNPEYAEWFRQKVSNGLKLYYENNDSPWVGRKHKQSTKEKIGKANSKLQSGRGNSQYGTIWVTNGSENRKLKKTDSIPDGWHRGRKMK